ncbi:bifunctional diguanylate cyclase/phosphodiesterase [Aurantimonas sp. VKM B-3413]|uniref:putative bifunctional diguanylate cyclase/phosphodiesterase n=1 Tax=Aurantimonas sp. VKM B-3413 TaxID=2779401 RepID=UPI001E366A25|nr:EAL domain-containing protein [Aurantimonas sp. VKM B-3413]MCB8835839.1 EAL domain-containing protein [Aurantimonas sp. VKM B-3413]
MRPAPISIDEKERLNAVAEYQTGIESISADLDRIALLASSVFQVPMGLVSFVERNRQVFLAKVGLEACETDREISFCAHAIHGADIFVVLDASLDRRFDDNPLVIGAPHIRFYAGAPLTVRNGQTIGTLCIVDTQPRASFSDGDKVLLSELAAVVLDKLELHRMKVAREESHARFVAAAEASPDGILCTDGSGIITFWNTACELMFNRPSEEALGHPITIIMPSKSAEEPRLKVIGDGSELLVGRSIELTAARRDGAEFPIELTLTEWRDGALSSFGCIVRDVTERRANEERLFKLAHFDALTGLPNRAVLKARLDAIGKNSEAACVLSIDLDDFKEVNDTLGHLVGDALLNSVAGRLVACTRPIDTVARIGGDEFVMLLPGVGDPVQAAVVADRVIAAVAEVFVFEGQSVNVSASVGFAIHPTFGQDSGDLISNADLALYQAKAEGRHCRRMFMPALRDRAVQRRTQDFELRLAYERGEFELFYQPQVRLADGALLGAEALLRWRHPTLGMLAPASFLPTLDAGPLAASVGNWVLTKACEQGAHWRRHGAPAFRVGVNLFGAQFRTDSLSERVRSVLVATGLPPTALELEITENIILRHDGEMTVPLQELKELGVGIAFDDYGTGYASLSMLKSVPLTKLKLDQSFVRGMCTSAEDVAIVCAVLYLGRSFRLAVIAEGVENEAQRDILAHKGCQEAQGYLFGRPMSVEDFERRYALGSVVRDQQSVVV